MTSNTPPTTLTALEQVKRTLVEYGMRKEGLSVAIVASFVDLWKVCTSDRMFKKECTSVYNALPEGVRPTMRNYGSLVMFYMTSPAPLAFINKVLAHPGHALSIKSTLNKDGTSWLTLIQWFEERPLTSKNIKEYADTFAEKEEAKETPPFNPTLSDLLDLFEDQIIHAPTDLQVRFLNIAERLKTAIISPDAEPTDPVPTAPVPTEFVPPIPVPAKPVPTAPVPTAPQPLDLDKEHKDAERYAKNMARKVERERKRKEARAVADATQTFVDQYVVNPRAIVPVQS